MTDHAYSTDDPNTVNTYLQALAARAEMGKKIAADVKTLGAGPRVFVRDSGFGGHSRSITAIEQQGDHIPDGWRVVRGNLEPRPGKPGEAARKWLAEHQPVDVRAVMEKHGLPRSCWLPRAKEFGWTISRPDLFEHNGVLWACYAAKPGTSDSGFDTDKCTWTPRKLSEFHAAREAAEEAKKTAGVSA
jgi:hypothetical protein